VNILADRLNSGEVERQSNLENRRVLIVVLGG